MTIPLTQLKRQERRAAKARLIIGMQAGLSWQAAAAAAGITTSEATAFRLRRRVQQEGDDALDDHRHGYPYKLPPTVRHWLTAYCHEHPHTPSRILQALAREEVELLISVGYPNQGRAALDLPYRPAPAGKKV